MSTELDSLYQEIILDHYRNPHHKGLREPFEAEVHHVNPTCGDEVTLRVHVADGRVEDVSYDALGCSISQGPASLMTDLVIGKQVDEAMAIHEEFLTLMQGKGQVEPDEEVLGDGIAFAGVAKFPARIKCARLSPAPPMPPPQPKRPFVPCWPGTAAPPPPTPPRPAPRGGRAGFAKPRE